MIQDKKVLAIIPARGGSKTVPKKNIKKLNGKPLIVYSINQAKNSNLIDRVVVSTDSEEIADVARQAGAEVQIRPENLAQDSTPTLPVLQYVVKELEKEGFKADIVALLQPTSPFRLEGEIDEAITAFSENSNADSLMSVSEVPDHYSPFWIKEIKDKKLVPYGKGDKIEDDKKHPRKQDLPKTYWKNGSIYVISYSTLIEGDSIFGDVCMPFLSKSEQLVNIDTESDFAMADFFLDYFNLKID